MEQHEICEVEQEKLRCRTFIHPSLVLNPDSARDMGLRPVAERSSGLFDVPGGTLVTIGRENGGLYLTRSPTLPSGVAPQRPSTPEATTEERGAEAEGEDEAEAEGEAEPGPGP